MEKLVGALIDRCAAPALAARHLLCPADPTDAVLASLVGAAERPEPRGGLVCAWPRDARELAAAKVALAPCTSLLLAVREVVHWDDRKRAERARSEAQPSEVRTGKRAERARSEAQPSEDPMGWPDSAIVLVYFVRRRRDLSFEAFETHYRERHALLARIHHPGIARYVQNFAADGGSGGIDAISELWFRSEQDARTRFYRDDASRGVIGEDVRRFLDLRGGFAFAARPRAEAPLR